MTTAIQSVWLGQVALSSRDLVIHGDDEGAPGVREALRATMLGAVHGALMSLTREETYDVVQRLADDIAGGICDGRREGSELK